MLDFSIRLAGSYTRAQVAAYTIPSCTISLNVSGLRRLSIDGRELGELGPSLTVSTAGMVIAFEYTAERENWVLMGDTPDIRRGSAIGTIELRDGASWIPVPAHVPVAETHLPALQEEFVRLVDAFRDPLPARLLRIRLGLAVILRHLLDHDMRRATTPASRLKRMIDEDVACRESLGRMSRRIGFHADHLRDLFAAAYGITPLAYRNRCRLATAMGLIGSSALGVGEIGRKIGFAHVSHFSAFFSKASGMSPRVAIARFRNG